MTEEQQKEEMSRAYTWAVASQAGFSCCTPGVDDDSVDLTICARRSPRGGLVSSAKLDIQLKATAIRRVRCRTHLTYPLRIKNYDDLRASRIVPLILVVLVLPRDISRWLRQSEQEMASRHCAYWLSLCGRPAAANTASVTVKIPRANRFTCDCLRQLVGKAARGEPL